MRNLEERGDLTKDTAGRWIPAASLEWEALPARVEGVIAERLARLTDEAREVLSVASVMGRDFAAQVVAQVRAVPERDLVKLLSRELDKRHGLVQETGEVRIGKRFVSWYRFGHVLFQQYLYDELSAGERRLTHGDVAAALETLYEGRTTEIAAELARHYEEAGEDAKAVAYLTEAGDAAFRAYAQAEAVAYYSHALDRSRAVETAPEQLEHLYMRRGRALELSNQYDQALVNYEEAEGLGARAPRPPARACRADGSRPRLRRRFPCMGPEQSG